MTATGRGVLGVWHDVVAGQELAFDDWYNREHHAERVAIPGFLRARRYINLGSGRRIFSRYDVSEVKVLASSAYLAALNNPTPWSQRMFPAYRNTLRACFDVVSRRGDAEGGFVACLRYSAPASVQAMLESISPALAGAVGVLGVEIWRADAAVTSHPTIEKTLRAAPDTFPSHVLLIEACAPDAARAALEAPGLRDLVCAAEIDIMQLAYNKLAATI